MHYSISILTIPLQFMFLVFVTSEYILEEKQIYKNHLSTKTPYRFIENKDLTEIKFKGCTASKLWAVIRHGTRTPGPEEDSFMRGRLLEIRDLIVKYNQYSNEFLNVNDFKKWTPHIELDNKKRLTHVGEEEMMDLGQKFSRRFPSILPTQWHNSTYLFRFTDTSRTLASAKNFVSGLFGRKTSSKVWFPEPMKKDPILRFYKLCHKWRKMVKKNPETLAELNKFLHSDVFGAVLMNVTERLRLPPGVLNTSDIQRMYTACSFETSWDKFNPSAWCSILSIEEFKVLEYAEDLEYYWIDGYGYDLTTKIGCVMLKDVVNHLKNENARKAVFYFTHSGTVLKFLSHLRLYSDDNVLRHDNYHDNKERMWKTSKIDTFASNIAFVLFNCSEEKYVLTLHQERPVMLPGCPTDTYLCSLERIEQIYDRSLNHCDFDEMCSVETYDTYFQMVVDKLWNIFDSWRSQYYL